MRVYLDNCCFNRPYDDQTFETIRLETEAKLFVQESIRLKRASLIWSFMLDLENGDHPDSDVRESIAEWKLLSKTSVDPEEAVRKSALNLVSEKGIKSKDALHLAAAVQAKADYFLTTDRE